MALNLLSHDLTKMEETVEKIRKALGMFGYGYVTQGYKIEDIATLSFQSNWHKSRIWFTMATQLDDTDIYYFLPDRYHALSKLTEEHYRYVVVNAGDIQLYVMGLCSKKQPFAPFWTDTMRKNLVRFLPTISIPALHELRFALRLEQYFEERQNYDVVLNWEDAWYDCRRYQNTHRKYVIAVGKALDISMTSHDLTKTRMVQVALGYLYHWRFDMEVHNDTLVNLAKEVVQECHTKLEPHHPEFGPGFNAAEMFCDRIAVRIQKQPPVLEANGFDLHEQFIPMQCKDAWIKFKEEHSHVNMYKAVDPNKKWEEYIEIDEVENDETNEEEDDIETDDED